MTSVIPSYPNRSGWKPRTAKDFGDGGAYPEIHLAQYPQDLGRNNNTKEKTLALTVNSENTIKYDSILDPTGKRKIQSTLSAMVPMRGVKESEMQRPSEEDTQQEAEKTRLALEKIVAEKRGTTKVSNEPEYVQYTPAYNSGNTPKTRIIKMTNVQVDPLEPAKHKLKKAPPPPPEPPVPIMHSPPRKLTKEDQAEWTIPPCISNWKNNKGYTIPLDKRLSADGRNLREVSISDNFPKVAESLYIAEQVAREELNQRGEMERLKRIREKEQQEEILRKEAQESRLGRTAMMLNKEVDDEDEDKKERDEIRENRRRERERDLRLKRNSGRNSERDISERIALGMSVPTQKAGETMYDARLFNQGGGLNSGFSGEDEYSLYSKPLFNAGASSQLYRPKKQTGDEAYGNEEDLSKLKDTSKFKPAKGFTGTEATEKGGMRSGPVAFEEKKDDFGFDEFMSSGSSTRKPLDKIGKSGQMGAGASASQRESDETAFSGKKRPSRNFVDSSSTELKRKFN